MRKNTQTRGKSNDQKHLVSTFRPPPIQKARTRHITHYHHYYYHYYMPHTQAGRACGERACASQERGGTHAKHAKREARSARTQFSRAHNSRAHASRLSPGRRRRKRDACSAAHALWFVKWAHGASPSSSSSPQPSSTRRRHSDGDDDDDTAEKKRGKRGVCR